MLEISRKLSQSIEHPVLMVNFYQKTAKKQSLWSNFGYNNEKVTF